MSQIPQAGVNYANPRGDIGVGKFPPPGTDLALRTEQPGAPPHQPDYIDAEFRVVDDGRTRNSHCAPTQQAGAPHFARGVSGTSNVVNGLLGAGLLLKVTGAVALCASGAIVPIVGAGLVVAAGYAAGNFGGKAIGALAGGVAKLFGKNPEKANADAKAATSFLLGLTSPAGLAMSISAVCVDVAGGLVNKLRHHDDGRSTPPPLPGQR